MISSQTSTIEGEPEQRWPKYGRELKLPQDQVFIEGCFKDKPRQESIEKIQKAMRCNQCHEDGKMRNALLIPPFSNPGEAHRLIQAGAMPPRSTLDEVEKMALKVCLDKDRLLKTRDYLTEISCEAIPVAVPDLNPARAGVVAPEAISGREQKTPTSPRLQDSSQKTKSVISK